MDSLVSAQGVLAGCALLDRSLEIIWASDRFIDLLPAGAPLPIVGHHVRDVSPFIEPLGLIERLGGVVETGEAFDMDTLTAATEDAPAEQWKRSAYLLPTGHVLLVVERFRLPSGHRGFERD